jgi:hypothetical protein
MKHTYTFIFYTPPKMKKFNGILGEIDLYHIQLLLAGGKYLVEEQYDGEDPVKWYTEIMKDQSIYISNSKIQTYKGKKYIWMEIDAEKTPIEEFMTADQVTEGDMDVLAWKTFYIPCTAGTKTECLGLGVVAREHCMTEPDKTQVMLSSLLDGILSTGQ